ncbi:MAG: DUF4340 domain-containing protein [Xenococcaceae cyanobacterium MO_167.B52]|nr:DUF4340 domain-containing protein [Xenococcaceae cyanobacterium MO_167.B52]
MKLKKSTWFLLFLAISLGGWVYFYEIKLEAQRIAQQKQAKKVFDFDLKNIQYITIVRPVETSPEWQLLKLTKNQDISNSSWKIEQPQIALVNQGVISFLLNLIEKETIENKLLVTDEQLSQYGLDQPVATITIQLDNQQTYSILLGKETINPELIYAQINPVKKEALPTEVLLVSKNWHYAVIRELKEWQDSSHDQS